MRYMRMKNDITKVKTQVNSGVSLGVSFCN